MPDDDRGFTRIGKIRLGEQVATGKIGAQGEAITRPTALPYFRVDPEDEVTAPEAARSFTELYGDQPTSLTCHFAGKTSADCFEGGFRLYGTRKLKRTCDGTTCDERTKTGGWRPDIPCVCAARKYPDNHKDRCKETWTFSFFLMDVKGAGVWQIDTGSEISVRNISRFLQMLDGLSKGNPLAGLEFTLDLVPESVAPDGVSKTVHVLRPSLASFTPAEIVAGIQQVETLAAGEEQAAIEAPMSPDPVQGVIDEEEAGTVEEEPLSPDESWQRLLDAAPLLSPEEVEDAVREADIATDRPPSADEYERALDAVKKANELRELQRRGDAAFAGEADGQRKMA